jgi:type II secretory pathway component PulF
MALYRYEAFDQKGKKVSGTHEALSPQAVREQLARQSFYPTAIYRADEVQTTSWWRRLFKQRVTPQDRVFFTKQLSVLLRSGIPLLQALELLIEQTEGALSPLVVSLKDAVSQGASLADSLQKYSQVFDATYVQLVRAGEASGKLELILQRLTEYQEKRAELSKKITAALSYPLIQLGIITAIVAGLLVFVVPQITSIFSSMGVQLPLATRILMALSDFLVRFYWLLALLGIAFIVAGRRWVKTPSGRRRTDALILRLPLVSYFVRMRAIVQFSRTLGMLMEAGVSLAQALSIVVNIITNRVLLDALVQARDQIVRQGRITEYLKKTELFPPLAIYLMNTGEQTGHLDEMLLTVAAHYEAEVNDYTARLAARLDPIMMLLVAGVVGFIVLSMVLPLADMGKLAQM